MTTIDKLNLEIRLVKQLFDETRNSNCFSMFSFLENFRDRALMSSFCAFEYFRFFLKQSQSVRNIDDFFTEIYSPFSFSFIHLFIHSSCMCQVTLSEYSTTSRIDRGKPEIKYALAAGAILISSIRTSVTIFDESCEKSCISTCAHR